MSVFVVKIGVMALGIGTGVVYALLFLSLYFEVFLLVSFLESMRTRTSTRRRILAHFPHVAIIVPCFNEGPVLRQTVAELLALGVSVVVVDDGSHHPVRPGIGDRPPRLLDSARGRCSSRAEDRIDVVRQN